MENLVSLSSSFWRGRRVFVTGQTGFKGAWLWLLLQRLGAKPAGVALPPETDPNLFTLAGLDSDVGSRFVDIRDARALLIEIEKSEPEIVIHMAAQSLVRPSYLEPVETYATNVMGTINVLEAVRACPGIRAVLVVTSDKCYRNREGSSAFREDDPLGGHDPYSSSKASAEIATESWRSSFFAASGVAIATARAGNVIGGGDWAAERLIPDCVRAFTAGRSVELRNPGAVRPWQHVLEPLAGYLTLAERLVTTPADFSEAWNFGPDETDAQSVERTVATFAAGWGKAAKWKVATDPHPHEAMTLRLDASKARTRLGWRPRLGFKDAIAWTADWYRRWANGEPASALCEAQIDRYLSRVAGRK